MITERSAGVVVYRRSEDGSVQYLLLQAAPRKAWGFAKGKLDPGESERTAARRETREEAGISDLTLRAGFRHVAHYQFRRGASLVKKTVVYFLAEVQDDAVAISDEHVAWRWATLADAMDLVVFSNAREILSHADAAIQAKPASPAAPASQGAPPAKPTKRRRPHRRKRSAAPPADPA
jgi:bis(5'-nucleosidyl)-tetraphosphatase